MWDALECAASYGIHFLSGASRDDAAGFDFAIFTHASVRGAEQIQSELYLRAQTKVSHYVLVCFNEAGRDTTYVASVRFFVRAINTTALFEPAERFAVVRLYNVQLEQDWWGKAYVANRSMTEPPKPAPRLDPCIMPIEELSHGKVVFVPSLCPIEDMYPAVQEYSFLPYSHYHSAIDADAPVDYDDHDEGA